MGYQLGMERLNEYAAAFGLGEHTGIEISERTGARHENTPGEDQSPWAGFGQASQVYTPLQLASFIATLVRGGERLDAHLLKISPPTTAAASSIPPSRRSCPSRRSSRTTWRR